MVSRGMSGSPSASPVARDRIGAIEQAHQPDAQKRVAASRLMLYARGLCAKPLGRAKNQLMYGEGEP